ncbi:NAD-dependent SIR2 family protein deacetylase [Virgibacillus halotolerans]|uniref:hypothetical protein n=1 Tax=Virgibacillus halotolerans TaxID=1071053 RepID=UPI001961F23F|nr:hypothetical protein [Virgibacillus halotolerans]MBM7598226.1 NAD-dependent SIR2 family protein deacetylase [Virgibacillus halotolerans]
MSKIFNIKLPITYNSFNHEFDMEVGEVEGMLFITKIKTRKQRNYRTLKQFYREVNNIKVNKVDEMLESFSRSEKDIYKQLEDEDNLIEKLGIDKTKVAEFFKEELIKEIKEKVFR